RHPVADRPAPGATRASVKCGKRIRRANDGRGAPRCRQISMFPRLEADYWQLRLPAAHARMIYRCRARWKGRCSASNHREPEEYRIIWMGPLGLLVILAMLIGSPTPVQGGTSMVGTSWDLVVLGRIDFCSVCQREPSARVRYTQVLAGSIPEGQAR